MKHRALFALVALIFSITAGFAIAQDAPRPAARSSLWSVGGSCPAGQAATLTTAGMITCTDRIANSDSATTATTATTATNALNAVNATNLSGTLDASKITGTLSNSALPTCPTGQVATTTGCVAVGGGGGQVVCVGTYKSVSGSAIHEGGQYAAEAVTWGVTFQSLGEGQSSQSTATSCSSNGPATSAFGCDRPTFSYTCKADAKFTIAAGSATPNGGWTLFTWPSQDR